jgi:hypothetical protein
VIARFLTHSRIVVALVASLASLALRPSLGVADVPTGQPVDGIECQAMEGAVFHIHQHLAVFDHGKPVPVPDDLGHAETAQCLYWIHTHTPDGIIHVESPKFRTFVLGELFDIWDEPLTATAVGPAHIKKGQLRVFVNGKPYVGDPRKIELAQHTDITIEAGPPYAKPVLFTQWNGQ